MNQDVARRNHSRLACSRMGVVISRELKYPPDNEFSCATKVKGAGAPPKLGEKRNARIARPRIARRER